jgi:hypothetical protein
MAGFFQLFFISLLLFYRPWKGSIPFQFTIAWHRYAMAGPSPKMDKRSIRFSKFEKKITNSPDPSSPMACFP